MGRILLLPPWTVTAYLYVQNLFEDSYFLSQYLHSVWHLQTAFIILRNVFRQPYISRHFLLQEALYKSKGDFLQNQVLPNVVRASESCNATDLNTPGQGWLFLAFDTYSRSLDLHLKTTPHLEYKLKISAVFVNYYCNYCNYRIYFKILKQEASSSSAQGSVLTGKVSQQMKGNIPLAADYFAENKIENVSHSDVLMALRVWY